MTSPAEIAAMRTPSPLTGLPPHRQDGCGGQGAPCTGPPGGVLFMIQTHTWPGEPPTITLS